MAVRVRLEDHEPGKYGMIGRSPAMMKVYDVIRRVADSPATVYIAGESGTGKELVARALHEQSGRREHHFVAVNVTEFGDDELLEANLYGIQDRTATGVKGRDGVFAQADGGTLFLDEIAEMSAAMQAKLLRVLQERNVIPVGGARTKPVSFDARLVAASSRSLDSYVADSSFREDLFYRLNVVHMAMPPLRERRDDIPLLADFFLRKYAGRERKEGLCFESETSQWLQEQNWPGNVRELQNVIEGAVAYTDRRDTLRPKDFWAYHHEATISEGKPSDKEPLLHLREATQLFQQEHIRHVLTAMHGNMVHAAERLGVTRAALYPILRRLDIDPDLFRQD